MPCVTVCPAPRRLDMCLVQRGGPALVKSTRPGVLRQQLQGQQDHGTLTVAVQSGRGPEMQMLEPMIVKHCNQIFGYRAIDRITISQTTLTPLAVADMPLPPAPNTIKPDAETAAQIQKTRQEITAETSDELRKALDNLGKSLSGED